MRSLLAILFLFILTGCPPKVVVSPVEDPVWLEQSQPAPYEGWLVTQGWMSECIEHTEMK